MHVKLNIDNRSPVYLQLIEYFKEQIASGKLAMGEEIPSRRELARTLNINPNTVQRAYREMEEMGLIYTDGNMPSKVTRDETVIKKVREELVQDALEHFVSTIKTLQIPLEDVYPLLEKTYREKNGDKADGGEAK
ncbi:MAG: GntR family transcriptional regulator [Bacilli bacterium]|nr:GntR family transcriptional regulator [Bacilli bacterium]